MYPAYTGTGCMVGRHVWWFSGSTIGADTGPQPWQRCQCGRYTWEAFSRLAYQAEWGYEKPVASNSGRQDAANR